MPVVIKLALDLKTGPAVELRMQELGCETVEDYVRALIADDLNATLASDVESLLARRLAPHDYIDATPEVWADLERRVKDRVRGEQGTP